MLLKMLTSLETVDNLNQEKINHLYSDLTELITQEADRSMSGLGKKRKGTLFKPYWKSELSIKWHLMYHAEKHYRFIKKLTNNILKIRQAKSDFNHKCSSFDKLLRKRKRDYCRGLLLEIETCNTKNPRDFWKYIKKLGPCKQKKIPWEVCVDGCYSNDKKTALSTWTDAFKSLYMIDENQFDCSFKQDLLASTQSLTDAETSEDSVLNLPISLEIV